MSQQVLAQTTASAAPQAQSAGRLLQRQCDCGMHTHGQAQCAACDDKVKTVRRAGSGGAPSTVPGIVHDVLRSPGRPLDTQALSFMEPRFGAEFTQVAPSTAQPMRMPLEIGAENDPLEGEADTVAGRVVSALPGNRRYDFSGVRIHTDTAAARSARAINAEAYTIGREIVFGEGRYAPHRAEGRRLLAHELTHVLQQTGGTSDLRRSPMRIQRQTPPGPHPEQQPQQQPQQPRGGAAPPAARAGSGHAQRIIVSCTDMRLELVTDTNSYVYTMDDCSLPLGSYDPTVTVTGDNFDLDFGSAMSGDQEFRFGYRVEPGQPNPAGFLRAQHTVHVDVVPSVAPAPAPVPPQPGPQPTPQPAPSPPAPQCALRLPDRELVPAGSINKNLFAPKTFSKELWSHTIPLGEFGWVDVAATAAGRLAGTFSASYGPGRLSDICLTRVISSTPSSAPINAPLLGPGSRTDVTTYRIGGRARFDLPARASVRATAEGSLVIDGRYLSAIRVAAARGAINVSGEASASAGISASVEIAATATAAQATFQAPVGPLGITIEHDTLDSVDLSAEVGARARAGVNFSVNASAGFDLAGYNLWNQSWNLANFASHIAWHGGLKYSPNPGMHFNLGALGVEGSSDDEDLSDHEDEAVVHEDEIVRSLLDEPAATVTAPDGLSEDKAIPFDWYKPIELYEDSLHLANADPVQDLHRSSGPTLIYYNHNGRREHVELGVADWPSARRTFQFMPYNARVTPEQRHFNTVLDELGYPRRQRGVDAEHVWDVALRGLEFDRFDNLWPASNQEQQLAGVRHHNQMQQIAGTLPGGSANGRWFVIARVRHPA
ncbi:MAG TPA: DUF4157 domain-containing protein [Rhizomicrobium sp.]